MKIGRLYPYLEAFETLRRMDGVELYTKLFDAGCRRDEMQAITNRLTDVEDPKYYVSPARIEELVGKILSAQRAPLSS